MGYYPHFNLPMRSSRGFASTAPDLIALFRLAFASASRQKRLTLLVTVSRRIIMQKARRHPVPLTGHRAPTACRHVVSGSLSSPCRGSSHLSLALLGSLSVAREYLALRDGPRRFRLTFTCWVLLRYRLVRFPLSHTGLSPSVVGPFQTASARVQRVLNAGPTTPPGRVPRFGLIRVRSPLLTESRFLSFPRGTEMFQFPRFASRTYGFSA